MLLFQDLRNQILREGADFCGIANIEPSHSVILELGSKSRTRLLRAVSIGIRLPDSVIDQLHRRSSTRIAIRYRHIYDETNAELDRIASIVETILEAAGTKALAVPASETVDSKRMYGAFSHKMAAHLAGLGWIGKSCLLITPQAGPRVRWATVLTDAPLKATGSATEQRCGECRKCVDICPAEAFTGRPYRKGEHRDLRFDTGRCSEYTSGKEKELGCPGLCGLCVYICPFGKTDLR